MSDSTIFISDFIIPGVFTGSLPVDSVEAASKETFTLSSLTLRKDEGVSGQLGHSFPTLAGKMHLNDVTVDVEFFIRSQVVLDIAQLIVDGGVLEVEPQVVTLRAESGDVALRYADAEPLELTA